MASATIAGMIVFVPAIIAVMLLSASTAVAACGDNGDPGLLGPDGQCVGWCDLERICGDKGAGNCKAEQPSPVLLALWAVVKGDPSLPRCQGCGCKGGPGYRGPDGRCVGWDDLEKTCGSPPTLRCRAEIVAPSAAELAEAQEAYAARIQDCRRSSAALNSLADAATADMETPTSAPAPPRQDQRFPPHGQNQGCQSRR